MPKSNIISRIFNRIFRKPPGDSDAGRQLFKPQNTSGNDKTSSEPPSSVLGGASKSILVWMRSLWFFGRRRSITRGRTETDDNDIKSLTVHAEGMAEANRSIKWGSTESKALDDFTKDEIKTSTENIAALTKKLEPANTALHEVERERANNCRKPEKPKFPLLEILFCSLFFAMSLVASFHDGVFYQTEDERLSWAMSFIGGLVASVPVVLLLLAGYKNASGKLSNYLGIFGGAVICVGFAVTRVWSADGSKSAILLGLSLFLIEGGLLAALEGYAIGIRKAYARYIEDKAEWDRRTALENVARATVEKFEKLIEMEHTRLAACKKHIEERISQYGQIDALKQWAVATVLDGYSAGIAEVNAEYNGGKRRKYVDEEEEDWRV